MPSELENAMESLIKVFHRYASKDNKDTTLSRRELRELMEHELPNFLKVRRVQHMKHTITAPPTLNPVVHLSCHVYHRSPRGTLLL